MVTIYQSTRSHIPINLNLQNLKHRVQLSCLFAHSSTGPEYTDFRRSVQFVIQVGYVPTHRPMPLITLTFGNVTARYSSLSLYRPR